MGRIKEQMRRLASDRTNDQANGDPSGRKNGQATGSQKSSGDPKGNGHTNSTRESNGNGHGPYGHDRARVAATPVEREELADDDRGVADLTAPSPVWFFPEPRNGAAPNANGARADAGPRVPHRAPRRRRSSPHRLIGIALVAAAALLLIAGTAFAAYVSQLIASAPGIDDLRERPQRVSSAVLASDGSHMGFIDSDVIRTPIRSKDIPKVVDDATIAIEDRRFYEHQGLDPTGIVRAAMRNVASGQIVEGGSTVTMQLARSLYPLSEEKTFGRKIREAKLAAEIERRRSKRWILTTYLNNVSYGTVDGRERIGIHAAARTYFGKEPRHLTLAQAALLAGLPRAPSVYDPFNNPRQAKQRRNQVLRAMIETGAAKRSEARRAMRAPITLTSKEFYERRRQPFFFDYVERQLIDRYGRQRVAEGGITVRTTIVPRLQKEADRAIKEHLGRKGDPAAAVVTMDVKTGEIRAMQSSARYESSKFNLAEQGRRQPGSAFKTMTLMTAVRKGVKPSSTYYESKKLDMKSKRYGPIKVKTYDNSYLGRTDLVEATLRSDNTVYMQLGLDMKPGAVREIAYKMGITSELRPYPSIALGGLEHGVSPLEMSRAYATLAAGGVRPSPTAIRKVSFPSGRTVDFSRRDRRRVFTKAETAVVTGILEQNVKKGTGTRAQIRCPVAGKTGTTDDYKDAWFAGYTPRLSTAVWVGYPKRGVPMRNVHGIRVAGGTFPAAIWGSYMGRAVRGGCGSFPKPEKKAGLEPLREGRTAKPPSRSNDDDDSRKRSSGDGDGRKRSSGDEDSRKRADGD